VCWSSPIPEASGVEAHILEFLTWRWGEVVIELATSVWK
jgi:hypothetical protein